MLVLRPGQSGREFNQIVKINLSVRTGHVGRQASRTGRLPKAILKCSVVGQVSISVLLEVAVPMSRAAIAGLVAPAPRRARCCTGDAIQYGVARFHTVAEYSVAAVRMGHAAFRADGDGGRFGADCPIVVRDGQSHVVNPDAQGDAEGGTVAEQRGSVPPFVGDDGAVRIEGRRAASAEERCRIRRMSGSATRTT